MKIGDRVEMLNRLDLVYEVEDKGTIVKKCTDLLQRNHIADWVVRLDKFKDSKLFSLWNIKEGNIRVVNE